MWWEGRGVTELPWSPPSSLSPEGWMRIKSLEHLEEGGGGWLGNNTDEEQLVAHPSHCLTKHCLPLKWRIVLNGACSKEERIFMPIFKEKKGNAGVASSAICPQV